MDNLAKLNEFVAAEILALKSEKVGLALGKKAERILKKHINTRSFNRKALWEELCRESFLSIEEVKPEMKKFVEATTLHSDIEFEDNEFDRKIYMGANSIIKEMLEKQMTSVGRNLEGFFNEYVYETVDKKQNTVARNQNWSIKTESKACKYCIQQALDYSLTRKFRRHTNCRCAKVREK